MNSREKGKRGERDWAEFCRKFYGLDHARRAQQYSGTADSEDVVTWFGTHCEVKFVRALNIEEAMRQAEADAKLPNTLKGFEQHWSSNQVPYVAHRRNNTDWLVTVRAADLLEFCRRVLAGTKAPTFAIGEKFAADLCDDKEGPFDP